MEERKFIRLKKEEFGIKEYIKRNLGKGKISRLDIEYTPVGEKIIVATSRPGLVIGRRGEKIEELTRVLKSRFKLENPHIEISEIKNPLFDAQLVADEMALALERMGNLKFKVIAYRKLGDVMREGALGCEFRLTGKLPSDRAKSWRFAQGYLKKAGESRKEIDRAQATALTKTGIIGIKVAIMSPDARIYDRIDIDDKMKAHIQRIPEDPKEKEEEKEEKNKKSHKKKKVTKKIKEMIDEGAQKSEKKAAKILEKGETKVIMESQKVSKQEDGTAMMIEEEIEEGVPQDQIDKDIKKGLKKEEEKKEKAKPKEKMTNNDNEKANKDEKLNMEEEK
ncbi:30S ribosomal protein S3 [Candidatus Pacearchaeota archaeon]|nr:30S ribosomal protein S3 [Candidatus Pacearchaeota archaeon]